MIKFINKIYKFCKFNQENNPILGRWCHINMPKCNHDVLIKKIDMANYDNNFCIKPKMLNSNKENKK